MSRGPWVAPMCEWKISHIQRGLHLRSLGLSYAAIAVVLTEYHGLENCNANRARAMLREHGAPPNPRGCPENVLRGTVAS